MSLPAYRPLLRVRGSHKIHVALVGKVHTWLMHWDEIDRRTQPCLVGECAHCTNFVSRRPLSYVAVLHLLDHTDNVRWVGSILEVPLATGIELSKLHTGLAFLFRERNKGKITVGNFQTTHKLPDMRSFEIVGPLMRLWRIDPSRQMRLLDDASWSMWNVAHE